MTSKQRKSLPWRRFRYVILIIIKFSELLLWFSPRIISALRSFIQHLKECFIRYPNTSKLVKRLGSASFFQPTSQCLDIWWNTLPRVWDITLKLIYSRDYLVSVFVMWNGNFFCWWTNSSRCTITLLCEWSFFMGWDNDRRRRHIFQSFF